MAWNEVGLRAFILSTGKKTIDLPTGTLKMRAGRERVDVVLEETFIDWAEKAGMHDTLIKIKKSPDKKALLQYVRDTGEAVEATTTQQPLTHIKTGSQPEMIRPDKT